MPVCRVPWKKLGEPLPLNETLCLEGFNAFCWRRLLTLHGIYVESRRPGAWSRRGYTAHFRCISHDGCSCDLRSCMEYRVTMSEKMVVFEQRGDRAHLGSDRKISGLTAEQWKVLELAKPRGVADAVLALRRQNVGCHSARLLRSRVARPREGVGVQEYP